MQKGCDALIGSQLSLTHLPCNHSLGSIPGSQPVECSILDSSFSDRPSSPRSVNRPEVACSSASLYH
jgi:hypothetical protein